MNKVYIFGHRIPDTDSVTSAISLSYLKNTLGEETEPRVLGSLNKETKYALNFFHIEEPKYLNDVKLQLKNINYHKGFYIEDTDSIYNGYIKMLNSGLTGIPVIKRNQDFVGLLTIKDLASTLISHDAENLYTSYDNIIDVLKGESLLKFQEEIIGRLLVAAYRSTTFMQNISLEEDMILIVGDRHSIIEYAINSKVKCIILTGNSEIKEKHLEMARKNKISIIKTSMDSYHVARFISMTNYIKTMIRCYNPVKFTDTDFVDTVLEVNEKLKHTNYPIVNKKNKCLGTLKITDLTEKNPKQVILVDHNEKLQSVEGLEEAEILEIIDHHNLGNITTKTPINFRNVSVGSTNTILYEMYQEKNIKIPKEIAGIMLSGILSDTLILNSPTTTLKDKKAVEELSLIAEVNYEEYGLELLKAGTSLEGMSKEDVLYNDFKLYKTGEKTFAIGQFYTMNFDEIKNEIESYVHVLDSVAEANNYKLVSLYITDIIQKGSYVLYNSKGKEYMTLAYPEEKIEEGFFVEGCISRKKHVVPKIMQVFE